MTITKSRSKNPKATPVAHPAWDNVLFFGSQEQEGACRIKSLCGEFVGTTGFFRYRSFQSALAKHMAESARQGIPQSQLEFPGSIGAGLASTAMFLEHHGAYSESCAPVRLEGIDIHEPFRDIFLANAYPLQMRHILRSGVKHDVFPERSGLSFFDAFMVASDGYMGLRPDIHRRITYHPSQDFRDFKPDTPFDYVTCFNLLRHLDDRQLRDNVLKILSFAHSAAFFNVADKPDQSSVHKAIENMGYISVNTAQMDGSQRDAMAKRLKPLGLDWLLRHSDIHAAVRPF
ncbi:MAG: hypothetical protein EBQ96_07345 [Proteobacteria bacterium]|nr:hypothetical protein [Pseudomonadota bacterium]